MGLPYLTFSKSWTAPASDSGRYLPTIEDSEEQAREDLQVQHDDTAAWALQLVNLLKYATNLGESDDYSVIGSGISNVKAALLSLKSQITQAAQGVVADHTLTTAKMSRLSVEEAAAVGTDNIENGAITAAKLSVTDSEAGTLAAVTADTIRTGAVTHDKLSYNDAGGADAPVDSNNIRVGAIKTRHIDSAQVTKDKLSSTSDSVGAAVGTENIELGAVGSSQLSSTSGSEAVATGNIQNRAVTSAKLSVKGSTAGAAVATNNIQDDAVTADKLDDTTCVMTVNGDVGTVVTHLFKSGATTAFATGGSLTDYPCRASVTDADVTADDKVYVEFNATQINAGIFAPITESYAGGFYVFSEEAHVAETISYTIFKKGTQS